MAEEITGSRYQPGRGPVGGEREVRDRLLRGSRGRCFTDSFYGFRKRRYIESLRAYGEDLFWAIFGLELDCGKLWRRKSLGAGVYQPEDPWEARDRPRGA